MTKTGMKKKANDYSEASRLDIWEKKKKDKSLVRNKVNQKENAEFQFWIF